MSRNNKIFNVIFRHFLNTQDKPCPKKKELRQRFKPVGKIAPGAHPRLKINFIQ